MCETGTLLAFIYHLIVFLKENLNIFLKKNQVEIHYDMRGMLEPFYGVRNITFSL